ncbi:AAA family ATPase, partial [Phocaeicola sp. Sa1YUN3]|nr:AAA family ATPase [Phocaeicola faecium]
MRIEQVEIRNFRTIYNAKIDFTNITTFIGPNGVGKSTV